jgi:hypothetical protein
MEKEEVVYLFGIPFRHWLTKNLFQVFHYVPRALTHESYL